MKIAPEITQSIKLCLRAGFTSLYFWNLIILVLGTLMSAQFGGRQPSTTALDFGFSITRLTLPFIVIFLAQELFSKEFDRRYFLNSLTYPRSRNAFFIGRFTGLTLLTLFSIVSSALLLVTICLFVKSQYQQATPISLGIPYLLTFFSFSIDAIVICALATLLGISATTPSFVLIGVLGFTIAARSYSTVISLIHQASYVVSNPEAYQKSLSLMNYLLPDLGGLDIRAASLYGQLDLIPSVWPTQVAQALAFSSLVLAIACWALNRKKLS